MAEEPENLTLRLLREIRADQHAMRAELREHSRLLVALSENGRRIERRLEELRDDLELMLKAELMGRLAHFETRIEQMIEQRLGEHRGEPPSPAS